MDSHFLIRTERLELIAGTIEMAEAEMTNIIRLSKYLGAEFSYGWPPPENDETTMEYFFNRICDNPEARGWLMWYFIQVVDGKRSVIGCGGFTGMPNEKGVAECGYSILEPMQNQGFATEALAGLIRWAFCEPNISTIIAHTLDGHDASINVLRKNNFSYAGAGTENGTLKYVLKKQDYRQV